MRPFSVEDIPLLVGLSLLWIGVPAWIGYKLWSRRKPGRMRADPVDSRVPRAKRDRVTEMDAEYGTDYRGPGRKGEPFFSPGGLALIGSMIASAFVAYLLSPYIHAIADWLAPVTRSPR